MFGFWGNDKAIGRIDVISEFQRTISRNFGLVRAAICRFCSQVRSANTAHKQLARELGRKWSLTCGRLGALVGAGWGRRGGVALAGSTRRVARTSVLARAARLGAGWLQRPRALVQDPSHPSHTSTLGAVASGLRLRMESTRWRRMGSRERSATRLARRGPAGVWPRSQGAASSRKRDFTAATEHDGQASPGLHSVASPRQAITSRAVQAPGLHATSARGREMAASDLAMAVPTAEKTARDSRPSRWGKHVSTPRAQSRPPEPLHVPSRTGPDVGACQRQPAATDSDLVRQSREVAQLKHQLNDLLGNATQRMANNKTRNAVRRHKEDNTLATITLAKIAVRFVPPSDVFALPVN